MKAQIDEGTLEIWGENPTETWALSIWHKEHRISAGTVSIYPVSPEIQDKPLLGSMEALVAYSAPNWTPIPRQTGHRFQPKLDSRSSANWTPIPRQTGQFDAA